MITAQANSRHLNLLIGDIVIALQEDKNTVIRDEARLFQKQVIRLAPPKSLAQGRAAVAGDLLGGRSISSATGIKKTKGIFFKMQPYMPFKESSDKVILWVNKRGEAWGADRTNYLPNATVPEMKAFHRKSLQPAVANGGRIRVTTAGAYTENIGRWRGIRALVTQKSSVNKYVKYVQDRVGRLKASLAFGYQKLGGKVPNWIKRHADGSPKGIFAIHTSQDGISITLGSNARNARQIIGNTFNHAIRARGEAISKRLRLIASGYSKDVAAGIRVRKKAKQTPGSDSLT